jgi:hypothetical protein
MLRWGGPMKRLWLLLLTVSIATASLANTRAWKSAIVINVSETDVSGGIRRDANTLHYTIETDDMIYFVDYTYKPGQHDKSGAPNVAVNVETKIAVEGKSAYILDDTGKEVRLHVVKKTKK